MKRTLALVTALGALAAAWPAQAAQEDYVINAGGDYIAVCAGADLGPGDPAPEVPSPVNINGVCFRWTGSKSEAQVSIADAASGSRIGFYWQWYNSQGEVIRDEDGEPDPVTGDKPAIWGTACSPHTITFVPSNARRMKIWLDGPVFGPLDCNLAGSGEAGIATTGTVTATFKN